MKTLHEQFYGLAVGDNVFVNGHGMGKVINAHKSEWPSSDYVIVQMATERKCEHCPHTHECIKNVTIHPQHVRKIR